MKRLLCCAVLSAIAVAADAQTFRVYAVGGRSLANWHGQADVSSFAFELERPLTQATEVGFAFAPYRVEQPETWFGEGSETVNGVSAAIVLRHHFRLASPHVRPYVEAGSGPLFAERRVPAATSRFNFVTQGSAGLTLLPERAFAFIVGYRFMHISNGGYAPRNPGLNLNSIVIGARLRR